MSLPESLLLTNYSWLNLRQGLWVLVYAVMQMGWDRRWGILKFLQEPVPIGVMLHSPSRANPSHHTWWTPVSVQPWTVFQVVDVSE